MRSSTAVGFPDVFGRFTSMPRYIRGAVSMKMRSRTRMISTRGMMLISERVPPIRNPPEPPPSAESSLNAILHRAREPRARSREEIEEVEREALHLDRPLLDPVDEEVVPH